ncbi:MAG: nucleotidyltransferase family protein, partial [Anaerovorax sp.]
IVNKWDRAEMAIKNGIDLVLELPFIYACNNASYFAKGGVKILDGLGVVTHLSFGSEDGNLETLQTIAQLLSAESPAFKKALRQNSDLGMSFAKARGHAVATCLGEAYSNDINTPNHILAIEYLKQLNVQGSPIIPVTVKRKGDGYKEETLNPANPLASATAIRKFLLENQDVGDFIPQNTAAILKDKPFVCLEDFWQLLQYKIRTLSSEELNFLFSATEGLGNRIKNLAGNPNATNVSAFVRLIKSKRYPTTRIQRLLIHILFNLTKDEFEFIEGQNSIYGRVLGFNEKGATLLKMIKKEKWASIPILTNINKQALPNPALETMLHYDCMASDIYHLVGKRSVYENSDQVRKPFHMFL